MLAARFGAAQPGEHTPRFVRQPDFSQQHNESLLRMQAAKFREQVDVRCERGTRRNRLLQPVERLGRMTELCRRAGQVGRIDMASAKAATDNIRSKQDRLQRDFESIVRELAAQGTRIGDASAANPVQHVAQDVDPVREPDNPVDEAVGQVDRLASMDGAMFAQQSDPAWEDEAVGQVTAGFAAPSGSELQSVACHGAVCRVEVFHEDESAMMAMLDDEDRFVPWSHKGRIETIKYDTGEITTVMYVTREGHDFPNNF